MLVVTRYRVGEGDVVAFRADAVAALRALTGRPGCLGGTVGRAVDDGELWTLTTTWRSVGDYRRALSSYDVKLHAVPLMYRAIDEPSAYEPLVTWTPDGGVAEVEPARAPDADSAGPGRHT
jgi:Antibiotic biosynthesis monooxygenase